MNITIRDVDEKVFRKFKAEAVKEGVRIGRAVTRAMKCWLEKEGENGRREKKLLELKPVDWGTGSENSSVEIDELLHGG